MTRPNIGRAERNESGLALVEFSFVLVLFVMLLWGMISFGYAWSLKEQMYHAAQEGLRTGYVTPGTQGDDTAKQTAAFSDARQKMSSMLNSGQITNLTITDNIVGTQYPVCTDKNGVPESGNPRCMTITLDYDWGGHPVIAPLPGIFNFLPSHIRASSTGKIS
jgi:Flp pilus assembly protein TadG